MDKRNYNYHNLALEKPRLAIVFHPQSFNNKAHEPQTYHAHMPHHDSRPVFDREYYTVRRNSMNSYTFYLPGSSPSGHALERYKLLAVRKLRALR